jgi:hypothetical protein
VCEVDPLDLVWMISEGLAVFVPGPAVRVVHRSLADTFVVNLRDAPCDTEGWQ